MDLYKAIAEMKRISAAGGTFSLKFRKWNRNARTGGQLVNLRAAKLRPKASDESVANSSFKLFLYDVEAARPLNCWQMLVVEFNGTKITLN